MKLISMTDFVLEQVQIKQSTSEFKEVIAKYAKLLKQPLELWMIVPCDENGNILEEPNSNKFTMDNVQSFDIFREQLYYYQQAKERCLFDEFSEKDAKFVLFANETIEDLIEFNPQLTKNAIKQFGL